MNVGAIWKTDWFIGSMLTILFLFALQYNTPPFTSLENNMYDVASQHQASAMNNNIVIININQASLRQSQLTATQALAFTIDALTQAKTRFIAITTPIPTNDSNLIRAIQHAGNIVLPMQFELSTDDIQTAATIPPQLNNIALHHALRTHNPANPFHAVQIHTPKQHMIQAATGIGYTNIIPDADGITRYASLAMPYGQTYFPALALTLAASTLNISPSDIRISMDNNIELGALNIPTDDSNRILPFFTRYNEQSPFPAYTFQQLHQGGVPSNTFNHKIVLIGQIEPQIDQIKSEIDSQGIATTKQHAEQFISTPQQRMSPTEFNAHILQSILQTQMNQHPAWVHALELILVLISGFYLIRILPRLRTRTALIATGLGMLALISIDGLLLHYQQLWIHTLSAALLLLIGHAVFASKYIFTSATSHRKTTKNIHQTNKMLGISFQKQGMLDQAFEKFKSCPVDDDMLSIFYNLAQTFERKRQFKQATNVYEHIANHEPDYQDIQKRIRNSQESETTPSHQDPNSLLSDRLISGEHSPTLGRYEIINELGKGAMGTVYLGKDPKINRKVAIKTMALSQEFEPKELEEVKSKFFHEAEIAGMLNHPNIVTIFDAGDEQDLAYIAMEFLDGVDLSRYTKKDKLLPFPTTLHIIGKVAEALHYAHEHGVIHRDIKPANIMILKNKSVKVTDFGIAHIIDTSKTKAGVVLGTPSYMSPEQLSGKKLDGRSDLFSLGVMLYELSCGTRPFRAKSIAKLMYKIAKQPHVDIRQHNPDVPDCLRLLIDKLLSKQADQRISNARDVVKHISTCIKGL